MLNLFDNLVPIKKCIKYREEGEFLVVASPSLDIYYLNSVAKDFYMALGKGKSIMEIRDELLDMYDVDPNAIFQDLIHLVRDFQWKGLLVLEEPS